MNYSKLGNPNRIEHNANFSFILQKYQLVQEVEILSTTSEIDRYDFYSLYKYTKWKQSNA